MKVSDLINVCLDNVKLTVDGEGPALWRADFLKLYAGSDVSEREVAYLVMEPDGYGDVVVDVFTMYEEGEDGS